MQNQRFKDKVILVTGGNSGIGLATARRLVDEGARVIITGRDAKKTEAAAASLGPQAEGIVADVSKLADLEVLYSGIRHKYGHLDGLFANAGVALMAPLDQLKESEAELMMDTNIKGTYFTLQKATTLLSPGAAIVLNGSAANAKGAAAMAFYGATKAAVRSMARTFSAGLLAAQVRVNVVSPGPIETALWDQVSAEAVENRKAAVPLKRFGSSEEVANAVAFLLSEESSYIVGAELYVDGGVTQL